MRSLDDIVRMNEERAKEMSAEDRYIPVLREHFKLLLDLLHYSGTPESFTTAIDMKKKYGIK